jgi:hypothetical protein
MIHGLLDSLEPNVSDDEDDEQPEPRFVLCVPSDPEAGPEGAGGGVAAAIRAAMDSNAAEASVQPKACRGLVLCAPGAGTAYALSAFQLRPVSWTFEVVKGTLERTFPPPPRSPKFFVASGSGAADDPVAVAFLDNLPASDIAGAWVEGLLEAFGGDTEVVLLDRIFRAGWHAAGGTEQPQ